MKERIVQELYAFFFFFFNVVGTYLPLVCTLICYLGSPLITSSFYKILTMVVMAVRLGMMLFKQKS